MCCASASGSSMYISVNLPTRFSHCKPGKNNWRGDSQSHRGGETRNIRRGQTEKRKRKKEEDEEEGRAGEERGRGGGGVTLDAK